MLVTRTRATHPPVRLRATPPLDPPFDDETAPAWSIRQVQGQLALNLTTIGPASSALRPGTPAPGTPPLPPGALATATPETRQAAKRFLHTCLEILNGYRPVGHLRPLANPTDAETIIGQLASATERMTALCQRAGGRREIVQVRLLRVCEPRPGVAEAAAVLEGNERTWALAFRLERRRGAWLSPALRVI